MKYEVDPSDMRFTQDNIGVKFKAPFDSTRIDDAVDMIVRGEWTASKFACICVVDIDGVLFSLDNRRLWVFRKAALTSITVNLKKTNFGHPRLQCLTHDPSRMEKMKSKSFFPKVRGKVRQDKWSIPAALHVERSNHFSLAKENQLSPPVNKVSEVHHLGGVSRISVDRGSGERGTSIDIIDIGTEKLRTPVVKVGCGVSTQDKNLMNTIAEAERAQEIITKDHSIDTGPRSPWREFVVVHPRQLQSHSDSHYESPAVPHLGPVSRVSVDNSIGESGASILIVDITTEEVKLQAPMYYHQPVEPATVPAISIQAPTYYHQPVEPATVPAISIQAPTYYHQPVEPATVPAISIQAPTYYHQPVEPATVPAISIQAPTYYHQPVEPATVPAISIQARTYYHQPVEPATVPAISIQAPMYYHQPVEPATVPAISIQAPMYYHQPVEPATVPAISIEVKDFFQHAVIEGPNEMDEIQRKADVHCDEQDPPLQHQSVKNDTTVCADLEQDDVHLIFIDSLQFLSSSQHWWNSYFANILDRAWSRVKEAVQTLWSHAKEAAQTTWSYFKKIFSIPRG